MPWMVVVQPSLSPRASHQAATILAEHLLKLNRTGYARSHMWGQGDRDGVRTHL